jgi:hypothetical protein
VKVEVATDLPITAEQACGLAQKPALLEYVLWPFLAAVPLQPIPDRVEEGDEFAIRLRFLRVLPGWRHRLTIERLTASEIASREHGGPVKRWDHSLTFEALSPVSCRYTDAIEIDAGVLTPLAALFAHLMYRYRQARWRVLARILA